MFAELDDYNAREEFEVWLDSTIAGMVELSRMAGMTLRVSRNLDGHATYIVRNDGFDFTTTDRDRAVRYMRGTDTGL